MIAKQDLKKLARARLRDSETLFKARRYDGALYLCGYVLEMALKARLCHTLKWHGFPDSSKEFEHLTSLKTHNLEILLKLSGIESKVSILLPTEWSVMAKWKPELRYKKVGSVTQKDAEAAIKAAKKLADLLLKSI